MELISNTRDYERSPLSHFYDADGLFPSVNLTLHLPHQQQLRGCYGRSINRAEFREVSASVFYDFDLASSQKPGLHYAASPKAPCPQPPRPT